MTIRYIYDRTQADVDFIKSLKAKSWDALTENEKLFFMCGSPAPLNCINGRMSSLDGELNAMDGTVRGAYNDVDLNRVGIAVQHIADRFFMYGYAVNVADNKTDWTVYDIPTAAQTQNYLNNVAAIRSAMSVLQATPALPQSMDLLNYVGANAIEKTLSDIDTMITSMTEAMLRCGMPWAVSGASGFRFTA